jgi:hypothetical protein
VSKASDVFLNLVSRPLSLAQVLERREAERPRTGLVATPDGQLAEPRPNPRPVLQAPPQVID